MFSFAESPDQIRQDTDTVLTVTNPHSDPRSFLAALADELGLPSYAAPNWNSLDEALTDDDWYTSGRKIIWHPILPRIDRDSLAQYLDVLSLAQTQASILPLFHPSDRERIQSVLSGNKGEQGAGGNGS